MPISNCNEVLPIAFFCYTRCMNTIGQFTVGLFDLDGVILDTENQYTIFWFRIMQEYKGDSSLAQNIKGSTLESILASYFPDEQAKQEKIKTELDFFEQGMKMNYIPGLPEFINDLKMHKVKCAIVTSSNKAKMQTVYLQHPELKTLFDEVLTAEQFSKSKPAPDPYLLGAKVFNTSPQNCFVFEDSFNGLASGRAAGMHVVGLATTNSAEKINPCADIVIPDFRGMTYEKICGSE
jgi:beta-phosphoglucomutase